MATTDQANSRRDFLRAAFGAGLTIGTNPGNTELRFTTAQSKDFTVLFQGDSITDGNRSRNTDWNHVLGHGYPFIISSRLWYDNPTSGLHFYNRGISGNKVSDLLARWQVDALDLQPDLLSILVGVNDLNAMVSGNHDIKNSMSDFETNYRQLLDITQKRLPSTRLVICEPFILPVGQVKDDWQQWSAGIKQMQVICRRLASAIGATYVELQNPFDQACKKASPEFWIWDGIHPMPAGHELIARQWIDAVNQLLPIRRT